jgi:RNase adapter protein RapZ
VTVAEELADWLRGAGRSVTLSHRDAAVAGEAGGVGAYA